MSNKQVAEPPVSQTEQNVYAGVYHVLLGGMIVSSALFALGLVLALLHPHYIPLTTAWVKQQYHVGTVLHGLSHADPVALMLVATVLLILTPVARVLVSIYAFYADRDHKYVVVTGIVFLIMALTVVLGHFGLQ